jgi:hypothetical protein
MQVLAEFILPTATRGFPSTPAGNTVIEVHILIPVADNSGNTFDSAHDQAFENELVRLFGGYTGPSDAILGAWQHIGVVYRDQNKAYTVALRSLTDGNLVKDAAEYAKQHYSQLNIYIRYLGLSEIL